MVLLLAGLHPDMIDKTMREKLTSDAGPCGALITYAERMKQLEETSPEMYFVQLFAYVADAFKLNVATGGAASTFVLGYLDKVIGNLPEPEPLAADDTHVRNI